MSKIIKLLLLFTLLSKISFSQEITISGFVKDSINGERLIGAAIVVDNNKSLGTITDIDGHYFLTVKAPVRLLISYLGYESKFVEVTSKKSFSLNIILYPLIQDIEGIEIVENEERILPKLNVASFSAKEIERLPVIGGKPDILKSAQLMPGVETTNEATSLLLVRGGNPGENMYYIDNASLIYVNHLGGFMSVFNTDMINSLNIYKGGFPSKYGGKLSSIVEIAQKEGNKSQLKGSLNVGITDISFSVEGPTKLKNSSFIITGRKTLYDFLLLGGTAIINLTDNNMGYYVMLGFYDINGKFTWQPTKKDIFSLNVYLGDDYLTSWGKNFRVSNIWGNSLISGNWNRVISPKLVVTNSLSFVRYRKKNVVKSDTDILDDKIEIKKNFMSNVNDFTLRSTWKYSAFNVWGIEFGVNSSYILYNPNNYQFYNGYETILREETLHSFENSIFLDNKINLFNNIVNASLGFRLGHYFSDKYNNISLEPRANVNINVSKNNIINLSYMKVSQNSHLIYAPANMFMNSEMWLPAGAYAPTSYSNQISIGWQGRFLNNKLQGEVNMYYKTLHKLVDYKDGFSNMEGDMSWRNKLEAGGYGLSKGIEFILKKPQGKYTGFVAYTLSKTTRQFENINQGKIFIFDFDKTHSLSVHSSYKINKKWIVSASWNFNTGTPYTPITGKYLALEEDREGHLALVEVFIYGEKNSSRTRNYHRLDIGATYSKIGKRGRNVEWCFSIYNAYNRKNPYQYYYDYDYRDNSYDPNKYYPIKLYQMSFFPIIPSVAYKVYF